MASGWPPAPAARRFIPAAGMLWQAKSAASSPASLLAPREEEEDAVPRASLAIKMTWLWRLRLFCAPPHTRSVSPPHLNASGAKLAGTAHGTDEPPQATEGSAWQPNTSSRQGGSDSISPDIRRQEPGGRWVRVPREGCERGETISFSALTHLFPLQKGFTYPSPGGWYPIC